MLNSFLPRTRAGAHAAGRTLIAVTFTLGLLAPVAGAQLVRDEFWVVDGVVNAIAPSWGNTVYIGGSFTSVGPASGGGVPLSTASGAPTGLFPKVAGTVWAVASDGAGGWFIGGKFNAIDGVPRSNLGHVLADGSVAAWNPVSSSQVLGLAVSGSTVYAARGTGVLAFDAATGAPVAGWTPPAFGGLFTVAADGSRVYVGGFNGNLAALDAVTGAAVWTQSVTGSGPTVYALAINGATLYVGGRFTGIGGQPRNRIAALDPATGALTSWNPNADFNVYALAVDGSTIYAGGGFTNIGGQPRSQIAALDAATGAATGWNPNAAGGVVFALAPGGSTVYAGGSFTTMGGLARNHIAALDAATGAVTAWDPNANADVRALAVSGTTVYAGGVFIFMGDRLPRSNLAALDATTGAATAWDPGCNGTVSALAVGGVDGSKIYVGGSFTNVGGQARNNIAVLDAATGAAAAWDPNASGGGVSSFTFGPNTVYVGGSFTNIGGQARNRIAALDATTGAATVWNPNADNAVAQLDVSGNLVYAAGDFSSIGGQARSRVAALDPATGAATAWDPNATGGSASSLAIGLYGEVVVERVYVGGSFTNIGGQARNHIAALDPTTGAATPWNPAATDDPPDIHAIKTGGLAIYLGGHFINMNGQVRNSIAALDVTGAALDWDPNSNDDATVYALATHEGTVYVGGRFDSFGNRPQHGIAAIAEAVVSVPEAHAAASLELAQNRPNPAGTSTLIEFTLPAAAPVTLAVFDLLGRRVASLLEGEMRPAGANRVPFRPAGLAGGLYLYRLEALGRTVTRKMIVIE